MSEVAYKSIVEATYLARERMWFSSFSENLPLIKKGHRLKELEGQYKGSVVVVGAGPSVEKFNQLETLKQWKGLTIATDKQLIPMLKMEIKPEFVVTVDGAPIIADFYPFPPPFGTKEILPVYVHPSVTTRTVPQFTYWFVPLLDEGWETSPRSVTRAMLWMSGHTQVGHAYGQAGGFAWSLASYLGFDTVILVGLDFSYGPDITPMQTTYWKSFLEKHGGRTHDAIKSEYRWDSTPFGHRVLTDTLWDGYLSVFKTGIERSKVRTVNTSPFSTIHGKGVESISLEEALRKYNM